jgi:hypothetical protein
MILSNKKNGKYGNGSTRMSSKQTKKNFGSNRNKPKQDLFQLFFGLFCETKSKNFRFVSVFRTYIETTETNRNVSKQTKTTLNFLKNTKICSLSNCFCWSLFVSVQGKHWNSLFQNRSETTETNCFETNWNKAKQIETILNFLKKYQNMLFCVALLFVSVQSKYRNSLFRYRMKQPKQTFCFGSCQN